MGDEAANVEILKKAYKAWNDTRGASVDHWFAFLHDDIRFGSLAAGAAHVAFATNYNNKQALRAYFDGLLGSWEMIHFTPREYVAQGDAVVMRGDIGWRNKRTGKIFSSPKCDFWRFREGKAIEYFEFYDTAGLHAAAID